MSLSIPRVTCSVLVPPSWHIKFCTCSESNVEGLLSRKKPSTAGSISQHWQPGHSLLPSCSSFLLWLNDPNEHSHWFTGSFMSSKDKALTWEFTVSYVFGKSRERCKIYLKFLFKYLSSLWNSSINWFVFLLNVFSLGCDEGWEEDQALWRWWDT